MYSKQYTVFICFVLFGTILAAKRQSEDDWGSLSKDNQYETWIAQNTMSRENGEYHDPVRTHDTINIDEHPQGDMFFGSGDNPSDDDVEDGSGDDWDDEEEASGDGIKSRCQTLREELDSRKLIGAYMPRCDVHGNFEKKQCHGGTGECWCVDAQGREIPGTKTQTPKQPDCENIEVDIPLPKQRPGVKGEVPTTRKDPNGDISIDPTERNQDLSNEIDNMPETDDDRDINIERIPPNENDIGAPMKSQSDDMIQSSPVMTQPGILAGIIGGAVVGLLCAVLLVMFIVYRMRKKDEGSYALDEPKRSPTHHNYQRASTKEFYA